MPYTYKYGDRPLAGFTIQRAIGRGGFGEVYYAVADSGKQVALKYLRENPEIELRGIGHVLNLKSPHLITIYDVKQNDAGDWFVIMEYVTGPSLRELLLAEPGGMSPAKVAFLLRGIVAGLSYLHERGIVHRDLKPANIFYDDGYVKIGDYGLSKHISVSRHSGQTVSVGTVHYMAPEIGSGSYTRAIDIYALGVILYEMLTGRLPFTGSSMGEVLMRHLRDNPDLTGVPAPFGPVIAKALAKNPDERHASADELLAAVMESEELCRDLEDFDASRLTLVPRIPEASDARTVTAPQPPTLDVRAGALPDVGPLPDMPAPVREKLQRKLDRARHKMEARLAKAEAKAAAHARRVTPPGGPAPPPAGRLPASRRRQIALLTLVAAAVGTVLALLRGGGRSDTQALALSLYIIGGVVGPLVAHLAVLRAVVTQSNLLNRLIYSALAGLAMLPAYGVAGDLPGDHLQRLVFAPMAMVAICDWHQRIERGRRGETSNRVVLWPAIIGLVAAGIAGADDYEWVAAAVCATIALLTQSAAALWPVTSFSEEADVPARNVRPAAPVVLPTGMVAAPPTAETLPAPPAPQTTGAHVEPPPPAAQPSFARRSTSAGISFLAKMMLLAGIVLTFAPLRTREAPPQPGPGGRAPVPTMVNRVVDEVAREPGVKRPALVALALGTAMLILSRRGQGTWHVVRGIAGCGLIIGGVLGCAQLMSYMMPLILDGQWEALSSAAWAEEDILRVGVSFVGAGLALLLWPTSRPRAVESA